MADLYKFLDASKSRASDLITTTVNYLVKAYHQSSKVFTYASSYGQLLLVVHNLYQLVLFYISDSISQLNMAQANRGNVIFGLSRLTGHNPYRGKSAVGEIKLQFQIGKEGFVQGNVVIIPNYAKLTCLTNNMSYLLNLGADDVAIDITNKKSVNLKIIEGSLDFQTFTGTGESTQTYEANMLPGKLMDNDFIIVTVDGKKYDFYDSLYDIPFGAIGCLIKTGMTSGIDIIFGSKISTKVPPLGSQIRVDYLITSGFAGNIPDVSGLLFKFVDTAFDINGNDVNINDVFDISVELPPDFGADSEDPQMTKALAPYVSRNHIIHDEASIKYFLMKMNFFNTVKVFRGFTANINKFNVIATPKIKNRLYSGDDYFNCDMAKFTLTSTERSRLTNMIEESGKSSANISVSFTSPVIRKFAMMIIIEAFERYNGVLVNEADLRISVKNVLNNYFLDNTRLNKIPHSDIVKILDQISQIDTVKVIFVPNYVEDIDTKGNLYVADDYILINRGGFSDVDSIYYEDTYDPEGERLGSVNVDITFIKA